MRAHAFRAYGQAEPLEEARNVRKLAELLLRDKFPQVTIRDIQRRGLGGLQKAKQVEAVAMTLEQADWLRRETEKTDGRPRTFYAVNPKIWRPVEADNSKETK